MEEENLSPRCKNLSPDHLSKKSTRMNSCSTWMTINPLSLYLPVYLSLPSSSQLPTPRVFSSPSFPKSPPLSYQWKATKGFGFGYGISCFQCHSLTHKVYVCGWERCLQNLYQYNERVGKERWELGFSLGKALSFHTNRTSYWPTICTNFYKQMEQD